MAYHGHTPNFQNKEQYDKWMAQQNNKKPDPTPAPDPDDAFFQDDVIVDLPKGDVDTNVAEGQVNKKPETSVQPPFSLNPNNNNSNKGTSLGHYHRNEDGSYTNTDTNTTTKPEEKKPAFDLGLKVEDGKLVDTGMGPNIKDTSGIEHITVQPGKGTSTQVVPGMDTTTPNVSTTPTPSVPETSTPEATPTVPTPEPAIKEVPKVDILPEGQAYIPPKEDPTIGKQVYMNDDEVKNAFTYENRKKYNLDWDSTKTYQRPDGTYVIKDGKGNIYLANGEGEGMSFEKRKDWRDFDDDGNVSFGETLAAPFAGIYYGGKELVDGTKALFTNPSEKTSKWANDFKESVSMWTGGGDKFGMTRTGEVADRNGDGEVSIGERFTNTLGDVINSTVDGIGTFNDGIVNGQVKAIQSMMKMFGMDDEKIASATEGLEVALGMTNGVLAFALSPIFGTAHLASGLVDAFKSPNAKKNMEQNNNMKESLYSNTPSTPAPSTNIDESIAPPSVEEAADMVAQLGYKPMADQDAKAIDAQKIQNLKEAGEDEVVAQMNNILKLENQKIANAKLEEEAEAKRKQIEEETRKRQYKKLMDALDNAEKDELDNAGSSFGILPALRTNKEKGKIRDKYSAKRAEIEKQYEDIIGSDGLLKNYITRSMTTEKDPVKMLIGLKLMNSF